MRQSFCILLLAILLANCTEKAILVESGISKQLADVRKSSIKDLSYKLKFEIPRSIDESVDAIIEIKFQYLAKEDVLIDFKEETDHIRSIIVNGDSIEINHKNEHILIPIEYLRKENSIIIDFVAGNLSLNRNEDFLYTLLVPARARTVFPLFDQPNLKASFQLNLSFPAEWEAVTNGKLLKESNLDGRKNLEFEATKPIPSYLFAFAVGAFYKLTNDSGDMTMYYRESDIEKVKRNANEIFDLHRKSLDWLEDYTGIEYPFEKFDFALIPTFQYGGMEHPGAIFYRESALFLDESASINQQLSRAGLIAHETAHMWFGDLVTMDWFNDVWLKEVFANFYAAKIVNPSFPEVNHELRFLLSHYPSAYAVDRTKGTHPIQQELDNLDNAGSLYGSIIYQKAPIVMRNLEEFLGADLFQEGIKEYLNSFKYGNATWDDLINILAAKTELDLVQWNNDWIKSPGMPHILIEEEKDSISFKLQNGIKNQVWEQSIVNTAEVEDTKLSLIKSGKIFKGEVPFVFNANGRTYGYLEMNEEMLDEQLMDMGIKDEITRASVWMSQWENVLNGKKKYLPFFETLIYGIEMETNPLILNYQTSVLEFVFWNFLDEEQQVEYGPRLENMLFDKMMKTPDASIKRIGYDTYKSIANSSIGNQNLKLIWEDKLEGFDLKLSENDKTSLAYELALKYEVEGETILNKQYMSLKNDDNRKRMKFVMPSLSKNQTVRDSVFRSLLIAENRSQEPWVISVLANLHHPLRRESSIQYLKSSLEIIEEIKNTGDIFFPARWLGATFSNHNSIEAKSIVTEFINQHPDLSVDLLNKILQSTDMMERAELKQ